MLSVSKNTAMRYSQRDDFPTPVAELASGRIWQKRAVARWAERTLPLPKPGRPPRQR